MTPQEALQQIAPIANATLSELKSSGMHHSCIYAGAVLTKVLQRKGYTTAHPLTVRAFILNPELRTWAEANDFVIDGSTEPVWGALGGRFVNLGEGAALPGNEGKWLGHLVVVIPNHFGERHAFIDLTIPQVNQRPWKIVLPPILTAVSDDFVQGKAALDFPANASLIMYTAYPTDLSYVDTPLWAGREQYTPVVERIVTALK